MYYHLSNLFSGNFNLDDRNCSLPHLFGSLPSASTISGVRVAKMVQNPCRPRSPHAEGRPTPPRDSARLHPRRTSPPDTNPKARRGGRTQPSRRGPRVLEATTDRYGRTHPIQQPRRPSSSPPSRQKKKGKACAGGEVEEREEEVKEKLPERRSVFRRRG